MKKFLSFSLMGSILFSIGASHLWAQSFKNLSPIWSLKTGDRPYLTSTSGTGNGDNLQRGITYNPVTDHVLLVSRITNTTSSTIIQGIYILNANDGTDLGTLNTNGISSGTFLLLKIAAADDGAIYAANFGSQPGTTNTVYRWANEGAVPTIAFAGNPGVSAPNTNNQWGTTLDVRGAGVNTEIILGSNGKIASLLKTTDGVNFTPTVLVSDVPNSGDFEHGVGFDTGNNFWGKAIGRNLRKLNYDPVGGTAITILSYDTNTLVGSASLGQLAVETTNRLLALLETPLNPAFSGTGVLPRQNRVRLYDISNSSIPPVLLDIKDFPTNVPNRNFAGALDFGNGKLFALAANNGLMAFNIASIPSTVPQVVTAPGAQRVLVGSAATLSVTARYATSYQWQRNGTNISGATTPTLNHTNVQTTDSTTYTVVMSNSAGTNSSSAQLTVLPNTFPRLSSIWSYPVRSVTPPLTFSTDGNTPFDRSLAYHSLSNQIIYIDRTTATAGLTVNVLNVDSGAFLYNLKTTGISGGAIILLSIVASDDGSVYAGNMQADARTGTVQWRLYRWATTDTNLNPVLIFQGEPADLFAPDFPATRWGDTMDIRGSGTNSQIILDGWDQGYGSVLSPSDVNLDTTWNHKGFLQSYFGGSIGRSLQFGTAPNTFWQKRKADRLQLSSFDLTTQTSTVLSNYFVFPDSTGPVGISFSNNLLGAIDFAATTNSPDLLNLFDVADFSQPLFLGSAPFPTNRQGNNNFIGQVVFGGGKIFALDGNNGIMGLALQTGTVTNPPVILTQPQGLRLLEGQSGALTIVATDVSSYQWQRNSTNIPGVTTNRLTFTNAQLSDTGTYRVVLSNAVGITISSNVLVKVESRNDFYSLSQIWAAAAGAQPYTPLTSNASTPLFRSLAYNALSNQVYVVTRVDNTNGLAIYAIDANTGNSLYTLNTNGITPVSG
ncbi:MAG: hypothetical protein M3Y82_00040, partial [Verrucomicrobiota bacterium]|nr:hypothetical protein [Verrucomicrobiota bacterium]